MERPAINKHTAKSAVILGMLAFSLSTYSQALPPLERIVSVNFTDQSEESALLKLGQQAKITFSYSSSIVDNTRKIRGSFRSTSVRLVLETIFGGRFQYKEKENYIILTKAPVVQKAPASIRSLTISGYVVSCVNGQEIFQASIYEASSLSSAVTNAYGFFKLTIDNPELVNQVVVSKLSYKDTLLTIASGEAVFLTVQLSPEQLVIPDTLTHVDALPASAIISTDSVSEIFIDTVLTEIGMDTVSTETKFVKTEEKLLSPFRINLQNIRDTLYRPFQISFVPFVGTNHLLSGNVINNYSFNILGGHSKGTQKMEFGGLFNINEGDVKKFQVAGLFNKNGGTLTGWQLGGLFNINKEVDGTMQIGGLFNLNKKSTTNVQVGGLFNFNHSDAGKFQLAGLLNSNHGSSLGLQIGGLGNINFEASKGFQLGGLGNVNGGSFTGPQIAGLFNINVGKSMSKGFQLAGVANVATKEIRGVQIGLFNYAKRVKGTQIGIINLVDSLVGVSIGMLSIVPSGYHKLEISADEVFYTNIAFRTGITRIYNIITAGIKPGTSVWSIGYGFGTAPRLNKNLFLNIDFTANQVSEGHFTQAVNLVNKAYVGVDVQLVKKFSIAAGITLNAHVAELSYEDYPELFTNFTPRIIYDHDYKDVNVKMWWGAKVGVRFF